MQFTAVLPQTGQGTIEGAGLPNSSLRAGSSEGESAESGFLSVLQQTQSGQSAEATSQSSAAEEAKAEGQGAGEQSLALVLNLAAALLPPQVTSSLPAEDPTQSVPVSAEGLAGRLVASVPPADPGGARNHLAEQDSIQAVEGAAVDPKSGLSLFAEPAHSQQAGSANDNPQAPSFDGRPPADTPPSPVTDSGLNGEELRTGHEPERTVGGDLQRPADGQQTASMKPEALAASAVNPSQDHLNVEAAVTGAGSDPVFRLPNGEGHPDRKVGTDSPAGEIGTKAGEAPRAENSGRTTMPAAMENRQESFTAEHRQEDSSQQGADLGSAGRRSLSLAQAAAVEPGQEFVLPAAAGVQRAAVSDPPPPAAPTASVPTVSTEPAVPMAGSSKSVQFDLPATEFGQLRVRVVLSEQTVHTHMVTDRPDLGRLLVDRQDHLGAQLSTAGFDLGQLRVQIDRHGNQQQGYEAAYRQDARFHQSGGDRQQERQGRPELAERERAGALSLFA